MRLLIAAVWFCIGVSGAAAQPGLSDQDRSEIRAIIEQQLDAFQRDDGPAAFALAAPGIQARFRSPEIFMAMVRDAYQAVYRPRSVVFDEVRVFRGVPVQRVDIVGPDGVPVIASYPMQRQADGQWRIAGCLLSVPEGDAI